MAVMLEPGHGKDGNPSFPYVREHPTNYDWRQDIEPLTHRLVNRDSFRGYIWINTYERHPPGGEDDFWRHRDTTSFDVWGFDGRGDPLPKELGDRVYHALFHDPDPPDIWWIIWQGEIWSRFQVPRRRWEPDHFDHIHVTYLDEVDQR
jgi:hypothetical protein